MAFAKHRIIASVAGILAPDWIVLIILVVIVVLPFWGIIPKPKNFPPGPPKWPIIGNMFQMKTDGYTHRKMSKWHKKYGEVVGFFVGEHPVVLISGVSAIKEGLGREDLSGRLGNKVLQIMNNGKRLGIVNTEGDVWKEQRTFVHHHLRQPNIGKCSQETIIHNEVKAILDDIEKMSGGSATGYYQPVYFHDIFEGSMINILWNVLSGGRYERDDPAFKLLINSVNNFFRANERTHRLIVLFPGLAQWHPFAAVKYEIRSLCETLFSLVEAMIYKHKKTIKHDDLRDFTDIYLKEIMEKQRSPGTSFNDQQMTEICAEVLIGGADTTFATLTYAILFMVLFPDVQRKVQEELDSKVGKERLPSLKDKERLPYTEATVQEVLRLSSIAALCVPHAPLTTEQAVNFRGYTIPKGTRVHFNFYDLHHDPRLWDEPDVLRPERHLDENGRFFHHTIMFPFSGGVRTCPGQELARNSIFLILASILKRYTLRIPFGKPMPPVDPKPSVVLCPKRFEVKVQSRF
ncbi:methyl farnesoate epoxidase-like [Ischnura elegans]|uniref:methyl farnesoate epoxidase-like n=1 Tax=Ischnura elegans TaxID=197161 RepID=UPI001ED8984D|nr:methyl farnesoate epoxidase-like [Ischnura elegans]